MIVDVIENECLVNEANCVRRVSLVLLFDRCVTGV